jgi:penicillin amidase
MVQPLTSTPEPGSTAPAPPRRRGRLRRVLRGLGLLLLLAVVAAAAFGLWLRSELYASLPQLDGELAAAGLSAPVSIERDALGVPTIRAASRLDVAFATGFLHAQDRFFKMDLTRRQPAGELAELLGEGAVPGDRTMRPHRLREVARRALERAAPGERRLIRAYTAGVNAGLAALGARPFEYLVLRTEPAPWREEDTLLAVLAMFADLGDDDGSREAMLNVMEDTLPEPLFRFLAPQGTGWDAPLLGEPLPVPPIPGPEVFDLRTRAAAPRAAALRSSEPTEPGAAAVGSNNWAIDGAHTAHGGSLVACDMHLGLSLPNVWYRASFEWPAEQGRPAHRVTGATLPGAPPMVIGSNGRLAWGFTNSYIDLGDLVVLEPDPANRERYLTPEGPRELERSTERIRVRGAADELLAVERSVWGPVIGRDVQGNRLAYRWVAHFSEAVDLGFTAMETASGVDAALGIANHSGMPPLNIIVGDASGRIGWTIAGRVPRREGFDGRLPEPWSRGGRRWNGWLAPSEIPRVADPAAGRLWSANNRLVGGGLLARLGDGGYALGARADQIRDRLLALDEMSEADSLQLQLDDRALFLQGWRDLLLRTLDEKAVAADPRRRELREHVAAWDGRASVDSVGYRIVRGFRLLVLTEVFDALTAPCLEAFPDFRFDELGQSEGPLWRMVTEKPPHLLDPRYATWDELLLANADEYLDRQLAGGVSLPSLTWGQYNTAQIRHPLSSGLPWLGRWIDMPAVPLPGGVDMPRFQTTFAGASQRMAVSPGQEKAGYFHMPGGQSGHPLSPHYGDSYQAWVRGEPTPFLPGPVAHRLTLKPPG